MAEVITNNTSLLYAEESSLGVLPGSPTWFQLEPNDYDEFGAEIATVARQPISANRQRRKGTPVGLTSNVGFSADTTYSSFRDFAGGFLFVDGTNADLLFRAAVVTGTGYTIPSATAAQAAKLQFTSGGPISLVYAAGYSTTANNGLKPLSADVALTDTEIQVAGLTAEASPPANAEVNIAGIRAEAGDLALAVSSGIGTLTSGNGASVNPIDFTTLGLTAGQKIHVGGDTDSNRFGSTAAADGTRSYGSARVRTIAAGTLTLDKLDSTLVASDGTDDGNAGTEIPVDLLFGQFFRNVPTDDADFNRRSFQFEARYPNLYETDPPTPVANPNGHEYAIGNIPNELVLNHEAEDKATASFSFLGQTSEDIVDDASRKTNASSAVAPLYTEAYNTASDFFRLTIEDTDGTDLVTCLEGLTATIGNNVTRTICLGFFGARYINNGNFDVTLEGNAVFTNPNIPARIRANTTVTADWLLRNNDGAISVDVPSGTLSSDGKEYPVNELVRIQLSFEAHLDDTFGTSIGVSLFPYYPSS